MRRSLACIALLLVAAASRAGAQDEALLRGLELEQTGKLREAAGAYRAALGSSSLVHAMLGLERVYAELAWSDSLLPVLDSVLAAHPREGALRVVQLRTLRRLGRAAAARAAFERWVEVSPGDAEPFREYARELLDAGDVQGAESVLQRGHGAVRDRRELAMETAQLHAATGRWVESAASWRAAVLRAPYLEQAALYALSTTPTAQRAEVQAVLLAAPVELTARRLAAALAMSWGAVGEAWAALAELRADSASAAAWLEFADRAEADESWSAARDALVAALRWRRSLPLTVRAARAAVRGGEPSSALALLDAADAAAAPDSTRAVRALLPLRVEALAALGRAAEAEQVLEARGRWLDAEERERLGGLVAWGWIRRGDVARARARLTAGAEVDTNVVGWLALYEGDLGTARALLARASDPTPGTVTALALLARTRAERSPAAGRAFLSLARGDSAAAAAAFTEAAGELAEAAPLLLLSAATIHAARRDADGAIALWRRIVDRHPGAPEAAEADLAWARALRRRGDTRGAVERLEHLILTYPQSALVPLARRELELARAAVPGV